MLDVPATIPPRLSRDTARAFGTSFENCGLCVRMAIYEHRTRSLQMRQCWEVRWTRSIFFASVLPVYNERWISSASPRSGKDSVSVTSEDLADLAQRCLKCHSLWHRSLNQGSSGNSMPDDGRKIWFQSGRSCRQGLLSSRDHRMSLLGSCLSG